jgi:hypothetical protein
MDLMLVITQLERRTARDFGTAVLVSRTETKEAP